jgi:hypothetical protein
LLRPNGEYYNVWCFSSQADARKFLARFGGEMIDPRLSISLRRLVECLSYVVETLREDASGESDAK